MDVTELGIVNEVKPLQFTNASFPIDVTELGMVSVPVKPLQPLNACSPIDVIELGMMVY